MAELRPQVTEPPCLDCEDENAPHGTNTDEEMDVDDDDAPA